MTLPDLYVVGAPKAGTTSVAGWLAGHPDVFWSTPKEPFYWAADYPRMREHYGFASRAAYERLYSSADAKAATVRGDGSTTYLYSRRAVPAILRAAPRARFIVCLRDPVDLLVSYHRTQLVALNEDEPDFGVAWRRSLAGRLPATDPLDPKLVDYPLVGRLGEAFARLLEQVSRDRVHVVVFDDLVAEPDTCWESVAEFVGLDPTARPSLDARNRSDQTYRSAALRRLTHRPPAVLERPVHRLRQWSRSTALPGVAAVKRRMWREEALPRARPEDRLEVAVQLRDDVGRLGELLGRDLSHWATVAAVEA